MALQRAAEKAWRFLITHPQKLPAHGFVNPDDPNGGDYSIKDGDENELRMWAAAGLFHATGDREYGEAFVQHWAHRSAARRCGLGWPCGSTFAMQGYLDSRGADSSVEVQVRAELAAQAADIVKVSEATAYRVALTGTQAPFGYDWGSVGQALNSATLLLLAHEQTKEPRLVAAASAQLSWVLGVNPLGKALITGAGYNPVRAPHHRPSYHLGVAIPGAVGEGPNAMSVGGDPVLQKLFDSQLPPALRYSDVAESWATNEPTIYYNAAFVAVAAWFTAREQTAR
jgi:endoglucanase